MMICDIKGIMGVGFFARKKRIIRFRGPKGWVILHFFWSVFRYPKCIGGMGRSPVGRLKATLLSMDVEAS